MNHGCYVGLVNLLAKQHRSLEPADLYAGQRSRLPHPRQRTAEVIFICVGTPTGEDGSADLQYVLAAARDIGKAMKSLGEEQPPKIVVVKSTVPVGTTHKGSRCDS